MAIRAALLASACLVTSCATPHGQDAATIDHIVIVWLKRPGNPDDKARLIATSKDLQRKLPMVRRMSFGRPLSSERPVVDDTFDLAFVMQFGDRESLEAYEKHPEHVRATKEVLRPLSRKVVIYDIARN